MDNRQDSAATEVPQRLAGCEGTPGQGPFMAIVLDMTDGRVSAAYFQTYGCPASHACGRFVCEWAIQKNLQELAQLTEADVLRGTGPMPLGRDHCPGLAVRALHRCTTDQ